MGRGSWSWQIPSQTFYHSGQHHRLRDHSQCDWNTTRVPDLPNYSGFVISGSHFSVNDPHEWIRNLERFVLQLNEFNQNNKDIKPVKLFGICYGHQLIAKAFGGVVKPNSKGKFIFGAERIELNKEIYSKKWYQEIFHDTTHFNIMQSHGEEVSKIPTNAKNVGKSLNCSNEALAYGDNILTFQGHPELTFDKLSKIIGERLLRNGKLTDTEHNIAIARAKEVDSSSLTSMILRFLKPQKNY